MYYIRNHRVATARTALLNRPLRCGSSRDVVPGKSTLVYLPMATVSSGLSQSGCSVSRRLQDSAIEYWGCRSV